MNAVIIFLLIKQFGRIPSLSLAYLANITHVYVTMVTVYRERNGDMGRVSGKEMDFPIK